MLLIHQHHLADLSIYMLHVKNVWVSYHKENKHALRRAFYISRNLVVELNTYDRLDIQLYHW